MPGAVAVGGFAIDPDTTAPIDVHVYLDGVVRRWPPRRAGPRGRAPRRTPPSATRTATPCRCRSPRPAGTRPARSASTTARAPPTACSGCSVFTLPTEPGGSLDAVTAEPGALRVRGWTVDPDTAAPTDVHVYVDGAFGTALRAGAGRPDVAAARPGYGDLHGYEGVVRVVAGAHRVCAYAINVAPGSGNPLLGCSTATTAASSVLGSLDAVERAGDGARVAGWGDRHRHLGPDGRAGHRRRLGTPRRSPWTPPARTWAGLSRGGRPAGLRGPVPVPAGRGTCSAPPPPAVRAPTGAYSACAVLEPRDRHPIPHGRAGTGRLQGPPGAVTAGARHASDRRPPRGARDVSSEQTDTATDHQRDRRTA